MMGGGPSRPRPPPRPGGDHGVSRSNSMDGKRINREMSIFEAGGDIGSLNVYGRHTHASAASNTGGIMAPITKEALMEHNLVNADPQRVI